MDEKRRVRVTGTCTAGCHVKSFTKSSDEVPAMDLGPMPHYTGPCNGEGEVTFTVDDED